MKKMLSILLVIENEITAEQYDEALSHQNNVGRIGNGAFLLSKDDDMGFGVCYVARKDKFYCLGLMDSDTFEKIFLGF